MHDILDTFDDVSLAEQEDAESPKG
jgi:hypothetical protein